MGDPRKANEKLGWKPKVISISIFFVYFRVFFTSFLIIIITRLTVGRVKPLLDVQLYVHSNNLKYVCFALIFIA